MLSQIHTLLHKFMTCVKCYFVSKEKPISYKFFNADIQEPRYYHHSFFSVESNDFENDIRTNICI